MLHCDFLKFAVDAYQTAIWHCRHYQCQVEIIKNSHFFFILIYCFALNVKNNQLRNEGKVQDRWKRQLENGNSKN